MHSGREWVSPILATIAAVVSLAARILVWATTPFPSESPTGVFPLVIPSCVAVAAAWAAWRRSSAWLIVGAALTLAYAIITGFSIGGAYLPTSAILIVAATCALALGPSAPVDVACPACGRHTLRGPAACPACGAPLRAAREVGVRS